MSISAQNTAKLAVITAFINTMLPGKQKLNLKATTMEEEVGNTTRYKLTEVDEEVGIEEELELTCITCKTIGTGTLHSL